MIIIEGEVKIENILVDLHLFDKIQEISVMIHEITKKYKMRLHNRTRS